MGQAGWEWGCRGENGYTHTHMAEFLLHSPETTTTLLTGYTPKQNKKLKVCKKLSKKNIIFKNEESRLSSGPRFSATRKKMQRRSHVSHLTYILKSYLDRNYFIIRGGSLFK